MVEFDCVIIIWFFISKFDCIYIGGHFMVGSLYDILLLGSITSLLGDTLGLDSIMFLLYDIL